MSLSQLRLFQFRNIQDETLCFNEKNICFVGPNGQGKTNILEAVYLLSYGSSFRANQDSLYIQHQCSEMAISGTHIHDDFIQKIDVRIQQKKKEIRIDDSIITDRKELVGIIPSIVFCHTDIEFAAGSPKDGAGFLIKQLV
jgi:DNA replication and repair protein RecF